MSIERMHEYSQQHGIDINPMDARILDTINKHGKLSSALAAIILDTNQDYARQRIKRLEEHGVLTEVSPALYDTPERAAEYLPTDEEGDQE